MSLNRITFKYEGFQGYGDKVLDVLKHSYIDEVATEELFNRFRMFLLALGHHVPEGVWMPLEEETTPERGCCGKCEERDDPSVGEGNDPYSL